MATIAQKLKTTLVRISILAPSSALVTLRSALVTKLFLRLFIVPTRAIRSLYFPNSNFIAIRYKSPFANNLNKEVQNVAS